MRARACARAYYSYQHRGHFSVVSLVKRRRMYSTEAALYKRNYLFTCLFIYLFFSFFVLFYLIIYLFNCLPVAISSPTDLAERHDCVTIGVL